MKHLESKVANNLEISLKDTFSPHSSFKGSMPIPQTNEIKKASRPGILKSSKSVPFINHQQQDVSRKNVSINENVTFLSSSTLDESFPPHSQLSPQPETISLSQIVTNKGSNLISPFCQDISTMRNSPTLLLPETQKEPIPLTISTLPASASPAPVPLKKDLLTRRRMSNPVARHCMPSKLTLDVDDLHHWVDPKVVFLSDTILDGTEIDDSPPRTALNSVLENTLPYKEYYPLGVASEPTLLMEEEVPSDEN